MRKLAALTLVAFLLVAPRIASAAFGIEGSGLQETVNCSYGAINGACGSVDSDTYNIAEFIGFYIIQPVLGLLGLLFLCLTIYAGFLWMTAQGDDKRVQKAKDILTAAVVGAVIIVGAYAATNTLFRALETGNTSVAE